MNNALVLGPFVLTYSLLLAFAAAAATFYVGKRSGRKAGVDVETVLWQTLLVGLVVARLAFVWEFRSVYLASPLGILDIRDGGWSPTAGFVGAWLFALSRQGQQRAALNKALRSALMTCTLFWTVGAALLSARPDTGQEMPALSFPSLHGQPVALAAFNGKPTVLNLWADAQCADGRKQAGRWCVQATRATHDAVLRRQGTAVECADRRAFGCNAEREAAGLDPLKSLAWGTGWTPLPSSSRKT